MMSMMMGGAKYGVGGATIMTSSGLTSSLSPDPPSPVHSDSSNSNIPNNSPPLHTRGVMKECGVCGDVAKSMHFGGLSCDSCKAFFRRSVQNNAYKGFSCPYEKKCVIGVSSRKACQYCRFEKCISIGMEKGWVMSEDERRKMMEQRKERKMKQTGESSPRSTEHTNMYSLSEEDRSEIAQIVSLYKKAYNTIPYDESAPPPPPDTSNGQNPPTGGTSVIAPWMTFCKRIAYFFSLFRDFAELSTSDQSLLLRTALTSAGIIMGSVVYDSSSGKWAAKISRPRTGNIPNISSQSVEKLVPSDLITRVDKFFRKFQQICPDETMAMILILVSLYSPELMGLEARDRVQHLQERYIHILQNYVKYKFREKSSVMFPKAIVSLADIRELADRTGQMRIHGKAASMFSGVMQSTAGNCLGSPYSGLSLSSNISPPPAPTGEEMPPVCVSGPKNDPIYERIMKVVYQMHGSALNNRTPTLLPLIIQILKKWAYAKQEGRAGRALTAAKKAHRHSKPKNYRNSSHHHHHHHHRSRRMGSSGVKREVSLEQGGGVGLSIKEEIMDHSEDALLHLGPESTQQQMLPGAGGGGGGGGGHFGTNMSSQEFVETFPQIQQHHFQQQQPTTTTTTPTPPATSQVPHPPSGAPLYLNAPETPSYLGQPQSPPVGYPHPVSPEESFHATLSPQPPMGAPSPQHAMTHSPPQQQMNLSPHHMPLPESPHMPPMSPFPPPQQQQQQQMTPPPALAPYQHQGESSSSSTSSYACLGASPSPSPYSSSSSSSSSSPEDVDATRNEVFNEDLTETEFDVIMQLMERVSSYDGGGVGAGGVGGSGETAEILPMHLLREFQTKLCSLSNEGAVGGGGGGGGPSGVEGTVSPSLQYMESSMMEEEPQHNVGMGIYMEMDSHGGGGSMSGGVIDHSMSVMDLGTDHTMMDVDSIVTTMDNSGVTAAQMHS